jgi:hypothetical protein
MWTTMRKPRGTGRPAADGRLRRVSRVSPLAASRGHYACVSVWIEDLPETCDLNDLEASVDGRPARPFYVGPFEVDGSQQLIIAVPEASRTGLLPVEVRWLDRPLIETVWQRVVPPGPSVPRLISVTDGVELLSARIVSNTVKLMLEELDEPEKLAARIDDDAASEIQYLCVDPVPPRYEVNVHLPERVASGLHQLWVEIGNRRLAPIPIEVVR